MPGASVTDDLPLEEILSRLQTVVDRLEAGDLPLEKSLSVFEEGVQLSRLGQRRLEEADSRVERLLADGGEAVTRTLDQRSSDE